MSRILLKGKIVGNPSASALLIDGDTILSADWHEDVPENTQILDFHDCHILPAFIDIHVHGGGGFDFLDGTDEAFRRVTDLHLHHGTALLCPTLTASSWEKTRRTLAQLEKMQDNPSFGGIHLEGPFLSPEMCGAQNRSCLAVPTDRYADELLEYAPLIRRITAAPEVPGMEKFARRVRDAGIALSIGHSNADAETVRRAIDWGFTQVTHLYCSTSQRFKRGSYVIGGIVETALTEDALTVELIGDGHHICRESFLMTVKCKGVGGVSVISDAMRGAGTDGGSGESYLGEKLPENRVILEDGVAKLPDRSSFAGSLAAGDTMAMALAGRYGLPLADVSRMMSEVPAKLLGLADRGRLADGLRADITILDAGYRTRALFCGGIRIV